VTGGLPDSVEWSGRGFQNQIPALLATLPSRTFSSLTWHRCARPRPTRGGGGGESGPADASAGRDFLLHTANRRTASDLGASAADGSRLLEAAASPANLATALLNIVLGDGYGVVVDIVDLSKFFDLVNKELARPGRRERPAAELAAALRRREVHRSGNGFHTEIRPVGVAPHVGRGPSGGVGVTVVVFIERLKPGELGLQVGEELRHFG
jgi:hypothetical protein